MNYWLATNAGGLLGVRISPSTLAYIFVVGHFDLRLVNMGVMHFLTS